MNFYVYAYIRAKNTKTGKAGEPYYIGKGKDNRAYSKDHNVSVPKDKSKIIFLETNLTEIGALAIERRLIKWWGRIDLGTGCLHNKTDGGDGSSNHICSDELRKLRSERMRNNDIAKNIVYTEEIRKSRSERALGNKNALGGKSRLGQPVSDNQKKLNSEKHLGTIWWNNGVNSKKCKVCPGEDYVRGRLKISRNFS